MKSKTFSILAIWTTIAASIVNPASAADGIVIVQETSESKSEYLDDHRREEMEWETARAVDALKRIKPSDVFERVRDSMADILEAYATSDTYLSIDRAYVMAVAVHYDVTVDNYKRLGLSDEEYKWVKQRGKWLRTNPIRTDVS